MTSTSTPAQRDSGPSGGSVIVHVFGRTDVGRTREHNEDAFVVADLTTANATLQPEVRTHVSGDKGSLFMVADGMGGAAAGELASAMAVEVIIDELRERWINADTADPDAFVAALKIATDTANAKIHQYATEHPEYRGMGTTATIAGLLGDTLYLAQVGDSRAYLIRDGVARQITKDQSLVQKLIEAGEMTAEQAEQNERRNIILQALGPEPRIKIDLTHQQVKRDDVLVLCSDGLSGQVRPDEIAQASVTEPDLVALCKRLIDRANETGGPDNITVVAARFEGVGLSEAVESDVVGHRSFPLRDDTTPTVPVEAYVRRRSGTPPGVHAQSTDALSADSPTSAPPPARREMGRIYLLAILVLMLLATAIFAWRGLRGTRAPLDPDSAAAPVFAPDPAPSPATPDSGVSPNQ